MSNTIAKDVTQSLRDHLHKGSGTISAERDGVQVDVEVEQSERYAVGVRGVSVRPQQPINDVHEAAKRVVEGAHELGDPLAIVEYDPTERHVIARSAAPETDQDGVTYWEAEVRADEASLRRYRKDHAAPERGIVTEPLTHQAVGKIAEQLADAISPRADTE